MSEEQQSQATESGKSHMTPARRRRNWIIGGILAIASVVMYISIFIRLTVNPLE